VAIAFCVLNHGYMIPGFGRKFEAILTPSQWLADYYRDKIGMESTPIPNPIDFEDLIAPERDPIFVTMINPSVERGLYFLATLAEEIGRNQPKIAFLIIESRGTAGMVCKAGFDGGFDLRRHPNIMIATAAPRPRDIYAPARMLLVPSVWEEPAGRVVPEALVNGVVPLVSDRGGLAESANGAGFVLPLPAHLALKTRKPVGPDSVKSWLEIVERLAFGDEFYTSEVVKVRAAGEMYRRENLAPHYVQFFRQALAGVR
jgi:glycosyltransferase involved in cell wall biosynthesis